MSSRNHQRAWYLKDMTEHIVKSCFKGGSQCSDQSDDVDIYNTIDKEIITVTFNSNMNKACLCTTQRFFKDKMEIETL